MSGSLAYVPTPRADETLSSLLIRLARNHGASADAFCRLVWPQFQIWTRDIDRTAHDILLDRISRDTAWSYEKLRQSTFRPVVQALGFQERIYGVQRGILPVGVFHRMRRRFGQQYCPICLAQKPAYLRRIWRLETLVICPEHGVPMQDGCPDCGEPFVPHRGYSLTERRCHRCGSSLLATSALDISPLAVLVQQAALRALSARMPDVEGILSPPAFPEPTWYPSSTADAHALLDGIHRLCRLAACHRGSPTATRPREMWAFLRRPERAEVMATVGAWLTDWPASWLAWAEKQRLSQHLLVTIYGPWPEWIWDSARELPHSFGPIGVSRPRRDPLRALRRRLGNTAQFREARARLLLAKAAAARRIRQ